MPVHYLAMAWRVDEHVIRGEIDNRVRGCVTGRIWFAGRAEPVALELGGNCWRDLAGRRLEFINPVPRPGLPESFAVRQDGAVGDITASRKVKVPEIPLDQIGEYYAAKKPWPWHWGNSLYLEWFSSHNGRVVIETTNFELRIVGGAVWEMTEAEETEQRRANAEAMTRFMNRLAEAAGAQDREFVDDTPGGWDRKPQTEEEAEAQQARSDKLADRIEARLRREGPDADYEKILGEELDRLDREEGRPEPTPEQLERNAEWIEELNRAGEEALENPDPELEAELAYRHPLVERVTQLALTMRRRAMAEGWRPKDASPEHPVAELLDAILIAGPKFAGALNGRHWPPGIEFCAHTIVRLKRARSYLDDALRAAESCREDKLIVPAELDPIVVKLTDLVRETDELIAELRKKLERGTD